LQEIFDGFSDSDCAGPIEDIDKYTEILFKTRIWNILSSYYQQQKYKLLLLQDY